VAQVRTLLAAERDRVVSFDDPDARRGYRAGDGPFLEYKTHEALDPDCRLITADVVPGKTHEAVPTDALLAKDTPPRAEGAVVIADTLYYNATTVAQVEAARVWPSFGGRTAGQ